MLEFTALCAWLIYILTLLLTFSESSKPSLPPLTSHPYLPSLPLSSHPSSLPLFSLLSLQHALEQEMKRNAEAVNDTISPQAQKAYLDTLADSLSLPNKPRNLLRVDDVVRKNEVGEG